MMCGTTSPASHSRRRPIRRRINCENSWRATAGCLETAAGGTPRLLGLAARGREAAFRDELLTLVRDVAERGWRETRAGMDAFDFATRPSEPPALRPRPYRPRSRRATEEREHIAAADHSIT